MFFGRRRRELEQQVEAARQKLALAAERGASIQAELTTVKAQLEAATTEKATTEAELTTRTAELETSRDASATALATLGTERNQLRAALSQATASSTGDAVGPDISWPLLLADLERRWPAPPGSSATPGATDDVAEQLSHALAGELERLREEVGVDAEVTIAKTVTPASPTVFLLAALDLIAALISICERVVVTLDDELRLIGRSWEGRRDELDDAHTRALAAGATVTSIEIEDDEVRLTLLPSPAPE